MEIQGVLMPHGRSAMEAGIHSCFLVSSLLSGYEESEGKRSQNLGIASKYKRA